LCEVHPTPALYGRALAIREKAGWSFYDSLIVSAALAAGCSILYSEDLQSGRFFEDLEIRNPFA
jgi:predicted nucleic acid-binding protein